MELLQKFLNTPDVPELGPGPRKGVQSEASLDEQLGPILSDSKLSKRGRELVRGTILLWHDHFEPAHEIAQNIEDADGSYLHAILHRREPDYSNSKYWFRRVGKHPCFQALARESRSLFKHNKDEWDPFAFVDACARVAGGSSGDSEVQTLRAVQALEFKLFLQHVAA